MVRRKSAHGYSGRLPVAEFVTMDTALRKAILNRSDAETLRKIYGDQPGFGPMRDSAGDLVRAGLTDDAEIARVLGLGSGSG